MAESGFSGVLVPVLTPFGRDLKPDANRFVALCKGLLEAGADGLAVFGTTSEANSMSAPERRELLERLVDAGVPAGALMPGNGASALSEAAENARHALKLGCGGVLMLPPFYYKAVTDDGLFDFYSAVIDRVGEASLRIYLYHIPPVAQVGISYGLIERLISAFPQTVVGLKDSSGDWENTRGMLERFPGFEIFVGSEAFLLQGMRHGARGTITAMGNINAAEIKRLYETWQGADADALQEHITAVRKIVQAQPVIPAMKALLARWTGDQTWATVRPPLRPVSQDVAAALDRELTAAGFRVPEVLSVATA